MKKLQGLSVLWVEDRPEALADQRGLLEQFGATVQMALTVNEAFELIDRHLQPIDLVIIDSIMPQRDELPHALVVLREKHNVRPDSELNGLILARWLYEKGSPAFFVLTVVSGERMGIDEKLFFDKVDEQFSGEGFLDLVGRFLPEGMHQ